jgi:hypothetical protein
MACLIGCDVRPDIPGDLHLIISSEDISMAKPDLSFRKRVFLNPISTGHTSYILAEAESSREGGYRWGNYMLIIADCRRRIELEFFLGTAQARRLSLAKIDLRL